MAAAFQINAFQPNAFQTLVIDGVLFAIDENDTGAFVGTVSGGPSGKDTHDGFTHKELKHLEKIKKKLQKLREQEEQAFAEANKRRKQAIKDVIEPPVAPVKEIEVELSQAIEVPKFDVQKLLAEIARLELQQQLVERQIAQKQAMQAYQQYMAHLEALHQANLEDEEALLMLL